MSHPNNGAPYGHPPLPPPTKGGGSGRSLLVLVIVLTVLVAVIAAVGVVAYQQFGPGEDSSSVAATSSSVTTDSDDGLPSLAAPSTGESASPDPDSGDRCPAASAGPTTPAGWKSVTGTRGLAYDVPPTWTVQPCGTVIGWEKKCTDGPFGFCPIRTMSGAATLESASCPKSTLADAGLPGASDTSDILQAVRAESALVADIYTSDSGRVPRVQLSAPRRFTVGGADAVQVVASVTGIETSACQGPTALHSMVATTVPGQPGSVMFVISLPQGMTDAVAPAVGDQMVATLRRTVQGR
ncbi:hypothetical protein ACQ7HM_14020 [Williamsia sp. MIQD14]|uniref:hypothetical protein n=1 Tax=Williamsia sp. MIQD14 TaxID=3425703 RepID=UPI003DA16905